MSYSIPESCPPCKNCRESAKWIKKATSKWWRLQWKKLGEDAPKKIVRRPHYC